MLLSSGIDPLRVEQEREGEADNKMEDHTHDREIERVADRLPEDRIGEDLPEVLQPDEGWIVA